VNEEIGVLLNLFKILFHDKARKPHLDKIWWKKVATFMRLNRYFHSLYEKLNFCCSWLWFFVHFSDTLMRFHVDKHFFRWLRSEILSNRDHSFFYSLVRVWSFVITLSPYENRTWCFWWDTLFHTNQVCHIWKKAKKC
jgi:hypothetical protein